jgi:ABC-type Co2+ transport system permease subunit
LIGAEIAFSGVVVAGVPAHLVLRRSRWSVWYGYAAAGLLLGCLAVVFRMSLYAWDYGASNSGVANVVKGMTLNFLPYAPLGAITGVTTGLIFWVVARPDRQVTQPAS